MLCRVNRRTTKNIEKNKIMTCTARKNAGTCLLYFRTNNLSGTSTRTKLCSHQPKNKTKQNKKQAAREQNKTGQANQSPGRIYGHLALFNY